MGHRVLQQAGRIGLAGSMLFRPHCYIYLISRNIRPRDKTAATEREREQRERERRSLHPIQRERPLANQMVNLSRNAAFPCASTRGFPPRSPESSVNRPWNPYPLLSKTLTVANIPPDFTPKDLYELFGEYGKAEGAFVYAFPDAKGRRVGEVAMATYLASQKVSYQTSLLTRRHLKAWTAITLTDTHWKSVTSQLFRFLKRTIFRVLSRMLSKIRWQCMSLPHQGHCGTCLLVSIR